MRASPRPRAGRRRLHRGAPVSEPTSPADLVILGGGSGGYAAAFRAAELGPERRPDREGQGRRHLPAPRLHPDQGPAARRRGRRPGPRGRAVRRQDVAGRHRHGRRQRLQGRRHLQALQGAAGPGEGPQDHLRRGRGPADLPDDGRGERPVLRGQAHPAGHRLLRPLAARPRHRRHEGHHQRPRAEARPGARLGDRPRRRRHRLRVRQRLEVLRRRRHHRRGAPPPRPAGGRVVVQAARARVPPPQDRLRARQPVLRRPETPRTA